jgi:nucleoside-diphosphate-sugar epimerase
MGEEKQVFLITGSSGFLGHALAHHFGSQNNTIVGFDMEGPPYPPPNTECLFCDLSSDESVQKTFHILRSKNGTKIKAVFHLAAYYSFSGEDSPLYKKITVEGTERMLRELQEFEVGQFIFSSSMLVHKPNEHGQLISEDSPIEPLWQYPKSKVETEKLVHEKRGNIPAVCLRIAGVYDDVCHSIPIAHQIQRIYEKQFEGHLYSGDTDVRQSWVHLSDVVKAFEQVVLHAGDLPPESTFLIGEPDAMSYDEMQKEIGFSIHGKGWETISVPKPIAKVGAYVEGALPLPEKPFIKPWMIDRADDNFELNIDKARKELGWDPQYRLDKVIPIMIEGLKVDPLRWYKINKLHPPDWLIASATEHKELSDNEAKLAAEHKHEAGTLS